MEQQITSENLQFFSIVHAIWGVQEVRQLIKFNIVGVTMFVVSWMKEKSSNTLFSDDNNFTLFSRKLHDKWREILQIFHINWSFSILRKIRDVIQWISLSTNESYEIWLDSFISFIVIVPWNSNSLNLSTSCRVLMFVTVRSWSINLDAQSIPIEWCFFFEKTAKCLESTDILKSVFHLSDTHMSIRTCNFAIVSKDV